MKFSHTTVLQNEMVSHVLTNTNGTMWIAHWAVEAILWLLLKGFQILAA